MLGEFLSLLGIASATALACNYHSVVAQQAAAWLPLDFAILEFASFALLLALGLLVLVRLVAHTLERYWRWESPHWVVRGAGLVVGGVRGLWCIGLFLLILLATGVPYVKQSIEERSVFGSRLTKVSGSAIAWVADRYPGHASRDTLIPPLQS